MIDINQSLAKIYNLQLEPIDSNSYIEKEINEALTEPIHKLGNEDLRILIAFDLYLETILPIALEKLKENPFLEGLHYSGDLLCAVLNIHPNFFEKNPQLLNQCQQLLNLAMKNSHSLQDYEAKTLMNAINDSINDSIAIYGKSYFKEIFFKNF